MKCKCGKTKQTVPGHVLPVCIECDTASSDTLDSNVFSPNDVRVTLGDCSTWANRIASWLYLSLLAWVILFCGEQDVTSKTTINQRKI